MAVILKKQITNILTGASNLELEIFGQKIKVGQAKNLLESVISQLFSNNPKAERDYLKAIRDSNGSKTVIELFPDFEPNSLPHFTLRALRGAATCQTRRGGYMAILEAPNFNAVFEYDLADQSSGCARALAHQPKNSSAG